MTPSKWTSLTGLIAAALVSSVIATQSLAISADCKARPRPDRTEATKYFRNEFKAQFSRAQCIVRTKVSYADGVDEALIENQLRREFSYWLNANEPHAAAYYWERGPDANHYLLYTDQCDRRLDITRRMLDEVTPCFIGEARIEMFSDIVKPGINTITVQTQEWTDSRP